MIEATKESDLFCGHGSALIGVSGINVITDDDEMLADLANGLDEVELVFPFVKVGNAENEIVLEADSLAE